jgi:hypothetical protein
MTADELRKRFPNASESFVKANAGTKELCPDKPECNQGVPLVCSSPREKASSNRVETRYRITFTVFSIKPCDYDNLRCKEIQDLLVTIGCLPADNWCVLEGCVVSKKAKTKEDECTIIEIEPL